MTPLQTEINQLTRQFWVTKDQVKTNKYDLSASRYRPMEQDANCYDVPGVTLARLLTLEKIPVVPPKFGRAVEHPSTADRQGSLRVDVPVVGSLSETVDDRFGPRVPLSRRRSQSKNRAATMFGPGIIAAAEGDQQTDVLAWGPEVACGANGR
jgi:hypothetical protein